MTESIDALLDALRRDQPADLSIERSPGGAEVKIGSQPIARVDEQRGELVVYAPADVGSMLHADYPRAREDPAGVAFDLSNADDAAAGFDLVRRRARVQRVGWQYRERSP
ncbi:MAG TPA: hypothetical protein VME22_08435 [Solirubrobacteraceae bacterium]|nr:hypothetical protein [Solirubrobacteraceae bacterium]